MIEEKRGGFCKQCKENRVIFRKGTNHVLHLILTILTSGIWLLVWIVMSIKFGGWRCTICGSSEIKS